MMVQQAATTAGLWVLQSHSGVQLQDAGRFGGAAVGLTQGGAVDLTAARLANALVGNHNHVSGACPAVLEITLGAAAFRAEQPLLVAFTGAAMPLLLNRQPVARYRTLLLQPGDLLEIGYSRAGTRAYLAVAGGFTAPAICGSVATVLREKVGGPDGQGKAISAGTLLTCMPWRQPDPQLSLPYHQYYRHQTIRALALVGGAQLDILDPQLIQLLPQRLFRVTARSDRMGMQLGGEPLPVSAQPLYSEGICLGAMQLPPNGLPIVMLNDHQTIGGYPKTGALTRGACEQLGQLMTGDLVRFYWQDAATAVLQERQRLLALQQQLDTLAAQWASIDPHADAWQEV
jgi:biotin-dependent carboxylase-like uncharacterized protein